MSDRAARGAGRSPGSRIGTLAIAFGVGLVYGVLGTVIWPLMIAAL